MKIKCDREKLLSAYQTAAAVAPSRSPKPILQNVRFDVNGKSATMIATDLEIGVRVDVAGVEIESPGSVVLPCPRFGTILRETSDAEIRIEADGQGVTIRGDRSEFKLPAENPAEFPNVADFNESKYHEVPARFFRESIRRTVFATDNESSRYALGGVLLELVGDELTAVATDGRRLARISGPARSIGEHRTSGTDAIVPTKAMQMLEKAIADDDAEVRITVRPNDIVVKGSRSTLYSRLLEGRFPKWRDVFPKRANAHLIEIVVGPFMAAIRQAAIITNDDSRGINFNFEEGKLELTSRVADLGQSRVDMPVPYDGDPVSISLDPRFMIDFLRVLDADRVITLDIKDAASAAVCSTDDGYGYVIMPLARDR